MKIICIGRNYINHAKELGNTIPSEPLFFLKPNTAIQPKGHPFFIPFFSNDIHYEVELVIKISKALFFGWQLRIMKDSFLLNRQ